MKSAIFLFFVASLLLLGVNHCAGDQVDDKLDAKKSILHGDDEVAAKKSILDGFRYMINSGALNEDPEEAIKNREVKSFIELRDEAIAILKEYIATKDVELLEHQQKNPMLLKVSKKALQILEAHRDGTLEAPQAVEAAPQTAESVGSTQA
ncbi:uncharacterized protein LOC129568124 [Sitodiplosis mosellana]|uniref:uncharacterized protein LOC129568124 n=1 Tax=Sitodiplosis mosellana TaxID=263140 RepID=UPI002443ED41|nr:uncharacterized protein LOC129568124 [Sitodiplosis mosellana]